MNEKGQFIGMACCFDPEPIDNACIAAFGKKVLLRQQSYGVFEARIGDKWYPCELSDLAPHEPQEFVESMKRIVETREVTA